MEFKGKDQEPFVPALIVVDMQEDFCPPTGSLAVQDGRSIAPLINELLSEPGFVTRIATQDYHPADHISFASNHPPPNNRPFESFIEMKNPAPHKHTETKLQQLWPVHCLAGRPGAEMIPEIDTDRIDLFVQKGKHPQIEMYSAFADAFGNLDPAVTAQSVNVELASVLRTKGVTDVFVVGLAGDYCVKCTAIDAVKAGFRSWLIEEGTKCVVPAGWAQAKEELRAAGVSVIHVDDAVKKLAVASISR
ncbi:isochorismatase family hydrolase [Penicillium canariense]|uniref:nicotinamidase n=1 Tax=Penicillium canariense TaxID=189055 RepID=A0A9W9LT33_9EURO|nr:isochorismatase family hydrolase [Penicillium canariense]KAJ5174709.1 isochorismatase family hydrolase [Penicillium canariense]